MTKVPKICIIVLINVLLALMVSNAVGQETYFEVKNEDGEICNLPKELASKNNPTIDSIQSHLKKIKDFYYNQNFLAVSIDSFRISTDTCYAFIYKGPKVTSEIKDTSLNAITQNINYNSWRQISKSRLYNDANEGFPLSRISVNTKLTSIDSFQITYKELPGKIIYWDSIELKPENAISLNFAHNYLFIKKGSPFEIRRIEEIAERIDRLNYLSLNQSPTIEIQGDKAVLGLDLKATPASQFDFLIGVLPSNENEETKFIISGELKALFYNKLKQGEKLFLHFQQLKPETQRIEIGLDYPYLFTLPFGVNGSFLLYKNDINTLDVFSKVGLTYQSSNYFTTNFYTSFNASRIVEFDTTAIISSQKLPENLDVQSNLIGVSVNQVNLDYIFNPRRGIDWNVDINFGSRRIIPNNQITSISNENISFENAYDSLDLDNIQLNFATQFSFFIPIKKRSTLLIQPNLSYKWSNGEIYLNEYYRKGGSNNLRGFDEESLQAKGFGYVSFEYRYLLGQNSYFSTFVDYGWLNNNYLEGVDWYQVIGAGVGISFQTEVGIFGLDFAIGRQLNNPIDFRNTKTHFGYISLF